MTAIEIRDVHVSYRIIQGKSAKKAFSLTTATVKKTHAVKGVTFDVEEGEIVGLVGRNGSGKSTLLRAIAGVFSPDSGTIDTKGKSVSLLAIGVGFQNELTGRDNIYLSGMLMGYSQEEINKKYQDIVDFSELEEFIDYPVKSYSSGMHSKLAFSISAFLEPDIILIDEVLSVGDRYFKKKSYKKVEELISRDDKTVIIVSHNSETIRNLCDRVVWLEKGKVMEIGDTETVLSKYNEYMDGISAKKRI